MAPGPWPECTDGLSLSSFTIVFHRLFFRRKSIFLYRLNENFCFSDIRKIEITLNMSVGDHKQSILEKMLWHSPYKPIMLWLPRQCTAIGCPPKRRPAYLFMQIQMSALIQTIYCIQFLLKDAASYD